MDKVKRLENLLKVAVGGLHKNNNLSRLHIAPDDEAAAAIFEAERKETARVNKLRERFGMEKLPDRNNLVIIRSPDYE